MAKTFTRMAAQGDFIIIRMDDLPKGLVPVAPENGKIVVAHSETGHDHVMVADRVQAFKKPGTEDRDLFELFLSVDQLTPVEHLRSFDTHETLLVPPGNFLVKRQREYIAGAFRRAAD